MAKRHSLIQDEEHPEFQRAFRELNTRLEFYIGHDLNALLQFAQQLSGALHQGLIDSYRRIINEHRAAWRLKGVDFPVLVLLIIPRLGVIKLTRADLSLDSIKLQIVNLVRETPEATMQEVVAAFRAAYPDLKPDDVAQRSLILRSKRGGPT